MSDLAEQRQGPRRLPRPEHLISRSLISENALKVLYRLHRSGFLAYLVGGAVRDLMLGRRPKDFDVGTNARPQQVRQLFRNARLIGRRFRLARIMFGPEVIEVATFRRSPDPPEMEEGETLDALAPVPDVEEYGTPEEDAWRRDFTVNGLFYNIADFSVIDYIGGLDDLSANVIRSIGPARERFAEDPVRMMRAVEYSARLGFRIAEDTSAAIGGLAGELRRAAPARIAYELLESLTGGAALPIYQGLEEKGLLPLILPEALAAQEGTGSPLLWRLLEGVDRAVRSGRPPSEETLLGALIVPSLFVRLGINGEAPPPPTENERLIRDHVAGFTLRLAFSNHRAHLLRSACLCLSRMVALPRGGRQVVRTTKQEGFPIARQLGRLLADAMEKQREPLDAWEAAIHRIEAGIPPAREGAKRPRTRRRGGQRRRRRRPGGGTEVSRA